MNFKSRKILLIGILIFSCLATLCCVAASENSTDADLMTIDESDDTDLLKETGYTVQSNDSSEGNSTSSISALDQFISDIDNAGSGDVVYLNEDIAIKDTIYVYEDITIDGQNHIIDGGNSHQIMNTRSKLTLKNIIFKNGNANGASGGAIYSRGILNINNCQFINNKADEGGAIDCYGATLTVTNSKFTSNSVKSSGGGILTHRNTKLTVKNCNFNKNTAKSTSQGTRGGAICAYGTAIIKSSTFTNNVCKAVASGKTPSKKQQSLGGALYLLSGTQQISGCTFTGNSVDNDGGAIFVYYTVSKLTVSNCKFSKNNAYYEDGGAISSCAKTNYFTKSTFASNYAHEDGGAIDTYSFNGKTVKVTVNKCTFKSNKGYKSAGAIYMGIKTKYVLKNSNFKSNIGTVAGCLFIEPSCSAIISNCKFDKNAAANVARKIVYSKSKKVVKHSGGAIYSKSKSTTISKSTFTSNRATYGGAICNHAKLTVKTSKFSKNNALSGGAYFHDEGTSILKSNKFISNKAKNAGGGLYFKKGKMKASKNKFSKNKAKYGNKYYSKKSIKI